MTLTSLMTTWSSLSSATSCQVPRRGSTIVWSSGSKPESTLSRKELYSRALLMFRVAPGDEFKSFVRRHKINELRPLFEYVN